MRECWALKVTECRIALQFVALLLDIFLQWTTPFITISITSQPSKYEFITIFINTMLIWVSYLSSYFCFCHEVFSKRKFWIGLWSGVWIALQKYCWSDPRIALQKLYWIGVWIAFQKFWSVQCTACIRLWPSILLWPHKSAPPDIRGLSHFLLDRWRPLQVSLWTRLSPSDIIRHLAVVTAREGIWIQCNVVLFGLFLDNYESN